MNKRFEFTWTPGKGLANLNTALAGSFSMRAMATYAILMNDLDEPAVNPVTPEQIFARPASTLTEDQRRFYFEQGYLHLPELIVGEQLRQVQQATEEMIQQSRTFTGSNDQFVLEPDHTAETPRLRRMNRAVDFHPDYWTYASQSILPDVIADLVGPDVKFRESMINFKWSGGGDEVRWHQDIPFYPHTNLTPLIALLHLDDVTPDMGPLRVIPGSHQGPLFEHYDTEGNWSGRVSDDDLRDAHLDRSIELPGKAGSLSIIHGCMIHGSSHNRSDRRRPLLVCGYSSADAFSYTPLGNVSRYTWQIVRGEPARYAHHEAVAIRLPPDWSQSYTSIFEDQHGEQRPSQDSA